MAKTLIPATRRDLASLWTPFKNKLVILMDNMKKRGFDCRVIETIRTYDRQRYLYSLGRQGIPDEKKVTWTMESEHLVGKAADIIPADGDWKDSAFFDALNDESVKIGLETLSRIGDRAHVQWSEKAQSKKPKAKR